MALTYIEALNRDGVPISIALPNKSDFAHETHEPDAKFRRKSELRSAARNFLSYLRFFQEIEASCEKHENARATFLDGFDARAGHASRPNSATISFDDLLANTHVVEATFFLEQEVRNPHFYQTIFPIKRLHFDELKTDQRLNEFFENVLGQLNVQGMKTLDARDVKEVVLGEFLENVKVHAKTTQEAFVAAHVRPPPTSKVRRRNFYEPTYEQEDAYFIWRSQSRALQAEENDYSIEVVVADAGVGVAQTLAENFREAHNNRVGTDNRILSYAFERWSTSKGTSLRRGTRGLYRLRRIAQKYNGMISLRSCNGYAGRDLAGANVDRELTSETIQPFFPGTVCFFHSSTSQRNPDIWRPTLSVPQSLELFLHQMGPIRKEGLEDTQFWALQSELSNPDNKDKGAILVFGSDPEGDGQLFDILIQLSEMRHPQLMTVMGLPGGKEKISSTVESVNLELEKLHKGNLGSTTVYDYFLVVGEAPNDFFWIGPDPIKRELLERLLYEPDYQLDRSALLEIVGDRENLDNLIRDVSDDAQLFAITKSGGTKLRLTPNDIAISIPDQLQETVSKLFSQIGSSVTITPSLLPIKRWVEVSEIRSFIDRYLSAISFALAEQFQRNFGQRRSRTQTLAFVHDETLTDNQVRVLSNSIGATRTARILNTSFTERVLDKGGNQPSAAVVFSAVLRSGKTTRQMIKRAIQGGGEPLCVLAAVDGREVAGDPIRVWGRAIPVYSVSFDSPFDISKIRHPEIRKNYISPNDYQPEEKSETWPPEIPGQRLLPEIATNKAIQFAHVGRGTGRHFASYFVPGKLRDSNLVVEALNTSVQEIIDEIIQNQTTECEWAFVENISGGTQSEFMISGLLHNDVMDKADDLKFVADIAGSPKWYNQKGYESSTSGLYRKNVVFFDWGSLTGATLKRLIQIASGEGVNTINIVTLFTQMQRSDADWYRSIVRVRGEGHDIPTKIKSLFFVPQKAFSESECPQCKRLGKLHADGNFMEANLLSSVNVPDDSKYRIVRRVDLSEAGTDPFFDDPENLEIVLTIRQLMYVAENSTQHRLLLLEKIESVFECMQGDDTREKKWASAFVHFLGSESFWTSTSFTKTGALQSAISKLLARTIQTPKVSPETRVLAINLLRDISKRYFIKEFSNFLKSVENPAEFDALLFGLATIFQRDFHAISEDFKKTTERIVRRSTAFVANETDRLNVSVRENILSCMDFIERSVRTASNVAEAQSGSKLAAWSKLQSKLTGGYLNHHYQVDPRLGFNREKLTLNELQFQQAISLLDQDMRDQFKMRLGFAFSQVASNWRYFARFLEEEVLPSLVPFENEIISYEGNRVFGGQSNAEFVSSLLAHFIKRRDIREHQLLISAERAADLATVTAADLRRFQLELEAIRGALVEPGTQKDVFSSTSPKRPPSSLIQMLKKCPCNAAPVLNDALMRFEQQAYDNPNWPGLQISSDLRAADGQNVFCSVELFEEVIAELFKNTRNTEASSVHVNVNVFQSRDPADMLRVEVSNWPSREAQPMHEGTGLRLLRRNLDFYGGRVLIERPDQGRFVASIDLLRS